MAGGTSAYQRAHTQGATGRPLSPQLAEQADADPKIDLAHDAGRNGVPYEQFSSENGVPGPPAPKPKAKAKAKAKASPSPRQSSGIRRSGRTPKPTPLNPTGGRLPIGTGAQSFGGGEGIAGVFFGFIAYALVLSVINYGASGPKLWFEAKFMNKAAPAKATS